jgi:hypothetical protein
MTDPTIFDVGSIPAHEEWGARDPDDHSRIHVHSNFEAAREAADWWNIDGKVYRRYVTDWGEANA